MRIAAPLRGWSLAILGALEPVLTPEQTGGSATRRCATSPPIWRAWSRTAAAGPAIPAKDVLTRLIAGEHDGRRLTEAELLQNCIFILNAGHETTTNLIGNAL